MLKIAILSKSGTRQQILKTASVTGPKMKILKIQDVGRPPQ